MRRPGYAHLGLLCFSLGMLQAHALAHGDRVIPQVADGAGSLRTKIDIVNLSPDVPITRLKIHFYHPDGTPWVLATNLGTADQFPLELGRSQVVRVETAGLSGRLASGYAVLRNGEGNGSLSSDFQVSVSVFYEVLDGSRVIDTVSVPIGRPTLRWIVPVDFNSEQGLDSGLALVNLSAEANPITLQLWAAFSPSSADASDSGQVTYTLKAGEQRARFLNEPGLFSALPSFRGVLVGTAVKPVSVLALLQTKTPAGIQYSTLAAEYLDDQHTESTVYLPQTLRLDADVPSVPYVTLDDSGAFDLTYQVISSSVGSLVPQNGAALAAIGIRTASEFDNLEHLEIRALGYSTSPIDLNDISGSLAPGFTFAVRTSLGKYAKIRITRLVATGISRDLVLQVYLYR